MGKRKVGKVGKLEMVIYNRGRGDLQFRMSMVYRNLEVEGARHALPGPRQINNQWTVRSHLPQGKNLSQMEYS